MTTVTAMETSMMSPATSNMELETHLDDTRVAYHDFISSLEEHLGWPPKLCTRHCTLPWSQSTGSPTLHINRNVGPSVGHVLPCCPLA